MSQISAYVVIYKCILSQAGIGISANTFLFLSHISTILLDHRPKPTDLTTCHLALVHIAFLTTVLFLLSPDLFESLNVWNDFKCNALFYINRVMKGLSVCTTCLMSIIQAITISPSSSWLAQFKYKHTHFIFYLFFFIWLVCLSFSTTTIFHTVASSNETQTNLMAITQYCSFSPIMPGIMGLMFILTTSRDIFLVGVMLLSSAYTVILLLRHQRRSQYLHSTSLSPGSSPEKRATQTILLLVSFFVVMYRVDFIISSSSLILWTYDSVIMGVQYAVVHVYATVSPLVLISSDKRILNVLRNVSWKSFQF